MSVAPKVNSGEQYASTIFKATVKYADKFRSDQVMKLFVKLIVPKVNAFSDENSFDTGKTNNRKLNKQIKYFVMFVQELNMYVNTLPDMQRLLSLNGEKVELAPR